mgnify:CR=1 FL=1
MKHMTPWPGGPSAAKRPCMTLLLPMLLSATGLGLDAAAAISPVDIKTIRLDCIADTAIYHHKSPNRSPAFDVNFGGVDIVPFHGIHYLPEVQDSAYFFLADFDTAKARGLTATGATLHVRLAESPNADKLRVVSVSTVCSPWKEGTGTGKQPETAGGGATANWAVFGQRRWADPQSELIDVTFGLGRSLYHTTEVRHEQDGWVAIDVPPQIAQALTTGASHGLALFEEKGQTKIPYRLYTRESPHKPYLEIHGRPSASQPAPAPRKRRCSVCRRRPHRPSHRSQPCSNRPRYGSRANDPFAGPAPHRAGFDGRRCFARVVPKRSSVTPSPKRLLTMPCGYTSRSPSGGSKPPVDHRPHHNESRPRAVMGASGPFWAWRAP